MTKVCGKCKIEKDLKLFGSNKSRKDGKCYECKKCRENITKHVITEKIKIKKKCSKCHVEKSMNMFSDTKQKLDGKYPQCKECRNERHNNMSIAERYIWREKVAKYNREKRKIDPLFKLASSLRTSVNNTLRENGIKKSLKTEQIIGCTFVEFKLYIENKFEIWMNWGNHGKYNGEFNFGSLVSM
jgi:hypothetical protein